MSNKRRYGEKETRKILQRAGEMQSADVAKDGVSLEELQQVAATVGFDPALVARAAEELDARQGSKAGLMGATGRVDLEEVVAGELTEERWGEMVVHLRRAFGQSGETGRLGSSYEWAAKVESGEYHFSASPGRNGVTLRMSRDFSSGLAGGWFVGVSMSFIFGLVAGKLASKYSSLDPGAAIIAFLAFVITALVSIRIGMAAWQASEERKCRTAMDRLTASFSDSVREMDAQPQLTVEETRLQITT